MLPVAVARSFSDSSRIRYVLLVLSITTCFPIMTIGAWCWHIDVRAVLKQLVKRSNVFTRGRHTLWSC